MKPIAIALTVPLALGLAIVLPVNAARAAAPRESEPSYRDLEAKSGLDLSHAWASYNRKQRSGSFAKDVARRFRLRRNVGLGLAVAGGALVFASVFFFCFGLAGPDADGPGLTRVNYGLAATGAGLGSGLILSGAVLAGVYTRRLDRLEAAVDDLGLGAYELASRNGGLGLRFAF